MKIYLVYLTMPNAVAPSVFMVWIPPERSQAGISSENREILLFYQLSLGPLISIPSTPRNGISCTVIYAEKMKSSPFPVSVFPRAWYLARKSLSHLKHFPSFILLLPLCDLQSDSLTYFWVFRLISLDVGRRLRDGSWQSAIWALYRRWRRYHIRS